MSSKFYRIRYQMAHDRAKVTEFTDNELKKDHLLKFLENELDCVYYSVDVIEGEWQSLGALKKEWKRV